MREHASKARCLRCRMNNPQGGDRVVICISLADVPSGPLYWDSEYEWVHARALCKKHSADADHNGYIPIAQRAHAQKVTGT
jgi:hypothetical protein